VDAAHRVRWEGMGRRAPKGARAAGCHDPLSGTATWEFALPLEPLVGRRSGEGWRSMGLSLALRADSPRGRGRLVAAWGRGLCGGLVLPELHEPIYLHPLTREAEEAALAIAHGVPRLSVAWDFFQRSVRARQRPGEPASVVPLVVDYLRRHPRGLPAERGLVELDRLVRAEGRGDPAERVAALARQAGVDPKAVAVYRRWAGAYLSQWVHLDPKHPPRSLLLQFDAEDRWRRAVYWGKNPGRDSSERRRYVGRRAGPIPEGAGWHELRVPLIRLGLHDCPIRWITFVHVGAADVVWDRTSVVAGGRETVVLDEPVQGAKTSGGWRWVTSPRKSGSRAHADARAKGSGTHRHGIVFPVPVVAHLSTETTGPVLSQWVYLDPKDPPRGVWLTLMSRASRNLTYCWGSVKERARYIGPLPRPGGWRRLVLPLAWTPFGGRAIHGIAFGHDEGRVWWDRTAIVKDGRETVVIEDGRPGHGPAIGQWVWVGEPVKSGRRAHTSGGKGRRGLHGTGYLSPPITCHLFDDPRRAEAILRANIPKLGPTEAAWDAFAALLDFRPQSAKERLEVLHWFLRSLPRHPRGLAVLESVVRAYRDLDEPRPEAMAEGLMLECGVPREVRYAFRRRFLSGPNTFVLAWRVLGPFPNPDGKGHEAVYPPETEPVDLGKTYEVVGGRARWRFHKAAAREVNLARLFEPNEHVVAYAVSWAYSERELPAVIELGTDDGCKLWVNRRLVLDRPELRSAAPGQDRVPVVLRKGWNEFLLKVDQAGSEWEFYFELVDREGRGLLDRLTTTPPPARR